MFGNSSTLAPKDGLIKLIKKNPPELFTALSNAIGECEFTITARDAAHSVNSLIEEIEQLDRKQLRQLFLVASSFIDD